MVSLRYHESQEQKTIAAFAMASSVFRADRWRNAACTPLAKLMGWMPCPSTSRIVPIDEGEYFSVVADYIHLKIGRVFEEGQRP